MSYQNHAWKHRPKAQGGTDPIEVTTTLPVAFAYNNGYTLTEGTNYSLTAIDGVSSGTSTGMMDYLKFANDPADGSLRFWPGSSNYRVNLYNGSVAVQVEAGVVIDNSPAMTGYVSLYVAAGQLKFQSPVTNVVSSQLFDMSDASNFPSSLWQTHRLAATIIVDAGTFDQDPVPIQHLDVRCIQETGGDLVIAQAWSVLTVLTPVDAIVTFP